MSKLWFFGDSYVAKSPYAKSWTINVQEAFPEYDNENLATGGSSLDYLYHTYEQNRKKFKSGDIVIMSITVLSRLFLRERTREGHARFLLRDYLLSPGDRETVDENHEYYGHFVSDLFNPEAHTSMANLFLNSLQYDAMTKGIKIIVLPVTHTFPKLDFEDKDAITIAKVTWEYYLTSVTSKSYRKKFNVKKWQEHPEIIEYDQNLANHLSPKNNEILANKVIRNIKTNEPIDLTTEWEL